MIRLNSTECTACGACIQSCPTQCITMQENDDGFYYPVVNQSKCIQCGMCEKKCMIDKTFPKVVSDSYYMRLLDADVLRNSSSGGAFYWIASRMLEDGGVVFGARYGSDFGVVHGYAENPKELRRFQQSKYSQSLIGNSYADAKTFLDNGRKVLFSGTPCQIGGLKLFLGREYKNLLTIDLICSGVAGSGIWHDWVTHMEERAEAKCTDVNLRDKISGWERFSCSYTFDNGIRIVQKYSEHMFCAGFVKKLFNRISCHDCQFVGNRRASDITIGDCWGYKQIIGDVEENGGYSVVLLNTEKGKNFFEDNKTCIEWGKAENELVYKYNWVLTDSPSPNPHRTRFFHNRKKRMNIEDNIKKCLRVNLWDRVMYRLKIYPNR